MSKPQWSIEQKKFIEQSRRWGHLSVSEAYSLLDELVAALEGLANDVAQYEAWQRPCFSLDRARALLAQVKP